MGHIAGNRAEPRSNIVLMAVPSGISGMQWPSRCYSLVIVDTGPSVLSKVHGTQMLGVLSAQGTSFVQLIFSMGQPSAGCGIIGTGNQHLPFRNCGAGRHMYSDGRLDI